MWRRRRRIDGKGSEAVGAQSTIILLNALVLVDGCDTYSPRNVNRTPSSLYSKCTEWAGGVVGGTDQK